MRTSFRSAFGRSFLGSVRWLIAVLAVPAVAAAQLQGGADINPGQAPGGDEAADQRYIVTFRRPPGERSADDRRVEAEALVAAGRRSVQATGGRVLRELPSVTAVAAWLPEQALEALRQDPKVERIEVDARRYLLQSGPPWSDTSQGGEVIPYGISMVQAGQLSDAAAGNRKVCIIDTGYYRGHDDLQYAHVTATPDAATGDPFIDPHGHGTHVAGTIAAVGGNGIGVRGVNPSQRIKLHIVKAFGKFGTWIYSSDLVDALSRCREAGAHVISMSFGGPAPVTAEATAFADAYAAGILPIAAAGNDGNSTYNYPASYESVVSVAAVDANENAASFSQSNDDVELAAPGVAVLSTLPPPAGSAAWNGTSMATPHVAGVAALVWSYNPSWTSAQIRQALRQTAKDKGPAGKD
ncbi:MAG TPA: S8 family serine peptidase, partial [Thermoanaerobaculia bacterium]|nr:S8 family serine peptidase [Thermoanaerobaculia bacterium]